MRRTPAAHKAATREPLSRGRALEVAVAMADAGGIESLSMRKLAGALGVEAMSLYYHVKSKEDILDGMVDIVFGEIELLSPDADWRAAMRERADSTRATLARHPWAVRLMDTRTSPGVATLRHLDAVMGCLRGAGFSIAMAGHAVSLLDSYVRGFAQQEASLPTDESGDIGATTESIMAQEPMSGGAFPHLAEMAVQLVMQPGYAYGNEFEFGLGIILDGIEAAAAREKRGVSSTAAP